MRLTPGYAFGLAFFLPAIAFAQTDAFSVIGIVLRIINLLVPIAITFAFLFFIWGLALFIKDSDNEEKRTEGKHKMFWGLIALFVIFAVWGLVRFIGDTFNVETGGPSPKFDLPYDNSSTYPDGRTIQFFPTP